MKSKPIQVSAENVRKFLTIRDIEDAGIASGKTIRRKIASGEIEAYRVGKRRPGTLRDTRKIRIPAEALDALLTPVTAVA